MRFKKETNSVSIYTLSFISFLHFYIDSTEFVAVYKQYWQFAVRNKSAVLLYRYLFEVSVYF